MKKVLSKVLLIGFSYCLKLIISTTSGTRVRRNNRCHAKSKPGTKLFLSILYDHCAIAIAGDNVCLLFADANRCDMPRLTFYC